jgi:hypothetical protein
VSVPGSARDHMSARLCLARRPARSTQARQSSTRQAAPGIEEVVGAFAAERSLNQGALRDPSFIRPGNSAHA